MAGHSHAANIKHRKNAQDVKKAKIATKLLRLIYVSARNGGDVSMNPSLRNAYNEARSAGIPIDRINAAIARAQSLDSSTEHMEEIRYNANFHGVSLIIECLTDNKNRTIGEIRGILGKSGAVVTETGSVEFMFRHLGFIVFEKKDIKFDDIFDIAVNSGSINVEEDSDVYTIETETTSLHLISSAISEKFGNPLSCGFIWKAVVNAKEITDEQKAKLEKLIDLLEDIDDIQNVYHN